jgi:hypothetical protein
MFLYCLNLPKIIILLSFFQNNYTYNYCCFNFIGGFFQFSFTTIYKINQSFEAIP